MKKADVLQYFGTESKVAKALGIKQPSVNEWGENIPQLRAYQLERITNGKLKVIDKRLDELECLKNG
jgi:DNA-binding transcriptional regulator YdaS (Cro superfamily)